MIAGRQRRDDAWTLTKNRRQLCTAATFTYLIKDTKSRIFFFRVFYFDRTRARKWAWQIRPTGRTFRSDRNPSARTGRDRISERAHEASARRKDARSLVDVH